MLSEINLNGDQIVAITVCVLIFLPAIISSLWIGKSRENKISAANKNAIPDWLKISENDFREKVKSIVQEELKKESDLMKAKDL
jgi:hypothetical protein